MNLRRDFPILSLSILPLALALTGTDARAEDPKLGAFDVPTVFFINKSDDRNRVDYGIHLDERCAPAKDEPVFAYWREFEKSPPVRTHGLGMLDRIAYGISDQRDIRRRVDGGTVLIKLKHVPRPILVSSHKEPTGSGRCSAIGTTTIAGVDGRQLLSVYVKLGGFLSVEYLKIVGKDLQTGNAVEELLPNR